MEDIHTAPYKIYASILENLPVLLRILLNGAYARRGLKKKCRAESAVIIKAFSNWLEKVVRRRAPKARTAYRMSQGSGKTYKACPSYTNL